MTAMAGGQIELVSLSKRFVEIAVDDDRPAVSAAVSSSPCSGRRAAARPPRCGMIAGFEQPTPGKMLLDGTDVTNVPPHKRNVNTVFQSYALFPHPDRLRQRRVRPAQPGATSRASRSGGSTRRSSWSSSGRFEKRQAGPAVRRPAAAGRPGPGAGARARRAAARRAARRPRRQAAPVAQVELKAAAGAGRHHLPVRDARPGRGADDVRPARGHARRQDRADRRARSEIYEEPADTYVADFLGVSNLMAVDVIERGPGAGVQGQARRVRAGRRASAARTPRPRARRHPARAGQDRAVRVRVRPGRQAGEPGARPWSSGWSTWARLPRCCCGWPPALQVQALVQNDGSARPSVPRHPRHVHLAPDALRVLAGERSAGGPDRGGRRRGAGRAPGQLSPIPPRRW